MFSKKKTLLVGLLFIFIFQISAMEKIKTRDGFTRIKSLDDLKQSGFLGSYIQYWEKDSNDLTVINYALLGEILNKGQASFVPAIIYKQNTSDKQDTFFCYNCVSIYDASLKKTEMFVRKAPLGKEKLLTLLLPKSDSLLFNLSKQELGRQAFMEQLRKLLVFYIQHTIKVPKGYDEEGEEALEYYWPDRPCNQEDTDLCVTD